MVFITKKGPYKALDLHDNEKKYVQAGGIVPIKPSTRPIFLLISLIAPRAAATLDSPSRPRMNAQQHTGPAKNPQAPRSTLSDRRAWFRAGRLGVGPICSTSWRRSLYEWGCKRTRRHRQSVSGPEPAGSPAPDGSETLGDGYTSQDEDTRRQR